MTAPPRPPALRTVRPGAPGRRSVPRVASAVMGVRRSVSFAITSDAHPGKVLLVRRPLDDADLPGVWGLPAGSLREAESDRDAVLRSGREKLGVELEVGGALRRGAVRREGYRFDMTLYAATIARGTPSVPQPFPEVTQYTDWRWGAPEALRPASEAGSLCSRLYLEWSRPP